MYATGTHEMNRAFGFDFLAWVPQAFVYVAVGAWAAVFLGLLDDLWRRITRASP